MIIPTYSKPILAVNGGMVWFYIISPANNPAITITEPMTLDTAKAKLNELEQANPAIQHRIFRHGMEIEVFLNMPYASRFLLEVMEGRA